MERHPVVWNMQSKSMEKTRFPRFCNCPECIVIILMKTNYQSTSWYSCVFLKEESCSKGFNKYLGLPVCKWVWACKWSFSEQEKGYITHLSNIGTVKSEWTDGLSKAACNNPMGCVCPAATSGAGEKWGKGWMLSWVPLLSVPLQTGMMCWLCPMAA